MTDVVHMISGGYETDDDHQKDGYHLSIVRRLSNGERPRTWDKVKQLEVLKLRLMNEIQNGEYESAEIWLSLGPVLRQADDVLIWKFQLKSDD